MSGVGQGTGEPLYTLTEARMELKRRDCATYRHAPSIEIPAAGERAATWFCDCGEFTYTPSGRS